MGQKQKAVTVHGEVEYETVECASCNQEFLPEDISTLYSGDMEVRYQTNINRDTQYKFKDTPTKIIVCENCIEYPQKITMESLFYSGIIGLLMGILIGLIGTVFLL